jgi:hypothetical protein
MKIEALCDKLCYVQRVLKLPPVFVSNAEKACHAIRVYCRGSSVLWKALCEVTWDGFVACKV